MAEKYTDRPRRNIQKGGVTVFRMSLYPCILYTLRVLYGRETLVESVICLKR